MAGGADHLLLDTVRRRLRQPAGWVGVVLHLSRLTPPAPRPHHRRIARVLMEDAARRHDGQVFSPDNGDLVLLCRVGDERPAAAVLRVASPQALPEVLARLLRADAQAGCELVSLWPLETAGEAMLGYALDRVATATSAPSRAADLRAPVAATEAIAAVLESPEVADLVRRQTAVLIAEDAMRPLFREVRFSTAGLEARAPQAVHTEADPFLVRHLAERLDRRLLAQVGLALGGGRALDPQAGAAPLHLDLTLTSLRSETFAQLAQSLRAAGLPLGVEVSVLDAFADPDGFEQARRILRRLGMTLVLDGVSYQALRLARVAALQPDLLKLVWSPRMADPEHGRDGAEQRLIRELGAERIVLDHAETEAALRWGLEHGIRRFQGRHVDAMLGALRLSVCDFAAGCTLQQCMRRAAAADPQGRRDCRNHELLDGSGSGARMFPGATALAAATRTSSSIGAAALSA